MQALYDDYLKAKRKAGRRPTTLSDIRNRVGKFAKDHGKQGVHEVTPGELERWIDALGVSGVSRANYIRAIKSFFKFAVRRGLIDSSPAVALEKPTIDEKMPEFLPPKDVARILHEAESVDERTAVRLAVQFFAGLRTAEVAGLKWQDLDLEEEIIRVRPEVAKKHRSRNVDIEPILLKWLVRYRKPSGPVGPPNESTYNRKRKKILDKVKLSKWPPNNAARHSYATYHLALHEDAAKTAHQLGHKDIGVLYNHYRGLAKKKDARKFWKIGPKGEESTEGETDRATA